MNIAQRHQTDVILCTLLYAAAASPWQWRHSKNGLVEEYVRGHCLGLVVTLSQTGSHNIPDMCAAVPTEPWRHVCPT